MYRGHPRRFLQGTFVMLWGKIPQSHVTYVSMAMNGKVSPGMMHTAKEERRRADVEENQAQLRQW